MRHRIKHHVNRPVLHFGLFSDVQILPAAGLFTVALGWLYAGAGSVMTRTIVAALLLLPVGIMVVDNRVGGIVMDRVRAYVRWHREPGIFTPGAEDAWGYQLAIDEGDRLVLEREHSTRVNLASVFGEDEEEHDRQAEEQGEEVEAA